MSVLHRVAVLALEGVAPFELGMPSRVFGNALTADGDALFTIGVTAGPEALAAADTVIIPPTHAMPGLLRGEPLPPALADALAAVRPGTRTVSICTGSEVLAAAGLLDGRRATTHWVHA